LNPPKDWFASFITSTLTVAAFKTRPVALDLWRAVEAQHHASTMVLVDTLDEQALLERILDHSKPAIDMELAGLHWLLFTPFRYPPLPNGSRFRSPADPGVFYGADERRTACAELGYWRWRFLQDSPALESIAPMQQTLFRTPVTGACLDLRQPPLDARHDEWTDPERYGACQELARTAREQRIAILRYQSVRDPAKGGCAALLTPGAFARREPTESQTWKLAVFKQHVFWKRDSIFQNESFEFEAARWKR
jgi:RES domain-containing protein